MRIQRGEKTLILINFYPCFSDFDYLTQFGEKSRDRGGGATYLSSVDEIQHKVQLVCSLEGVVKADQEGVFDILQQHVAFRHDVFLLS